MSFRMVYCAASIAIIEDVSIILAALPEVTEDPYIKSGIKNTYESKWQLVKKYSLNPVGICGYCHDHQRDNTSESVGPEQSDEDILI